MTSRLTKKASNYLLHDPNRSAFVHPFPQSLCIRLYLFRRDSSLFLANPCHLHFWGYYLRGYVTAWSLTPNKSTRMSWISGIHFAICVILEAGLLRLNHQRASRKVKMNLVCVFNCGSWGGGRAVDLKSQGSSGMESCTYSGGSSLYSLSSINGDCLQSEESLSTVKATLDLYEDAIDLICGSCLIYFLSTTLFLFLPLNDLRTETNSAPRVKPRRGHQQKIEKIRFSLPDSRQSGAIQTKIP